MCSFVRLLLLSLVSLAVAQAGIAATVLLGDQDFANGAVVVNDLVFMAPQGGEPAPIGLYIGEDIATGPFLPESYSASWTFTYSAGAVSAASTTLGIWEHDSQASGNQIASFDLDGVDLTAQLNALFEASGGGQAEVSVYTLALDAAALGALSDGSATFTLVLQGPGLAAFTTIETVENGAGVDFARLDLEQTAVPAPASLSLLGLGLAGLGWSRRKQ